MGTTGMIQTGIRLSPALYDRLKTRAKQEKRSLNNYITRVLEQSLEPSFPQLELQDFSIDEDLQSLGKVIGDLPEEQVRQDPRLKSILGL